MSHLAPHIQGLKIKRIGHSTDVATATLAIWLAFPVHVFD